MEEQVNTKTYLKNTMLMCCIYVSTNDSDVRYEYGMHPFCAPNISIKQDSLNINYGSATIKYQGMTLK